MNGKQLYGLRRTLADLRVGLHPAVRSMSLKQIRALSRVSKESKLTELDGRVYTNTFMPYAPSVAHDRYLRGIREVGEGRPVPLVVNFATTARCVCNCWHCSFSSLHQQEQLSLAEIRKAIGEIQDLGTAVIGFTGGEPMLRPDLEEIIAAVGERSMPLLFTTGWYMTPERARRLKEAGLGVPVVSLDHHTAEVHDRGRNKPGTFEAAVRAIRILQEAGFYVAVSFVPTRRLLDDPADFQRCLDFFRDLGVNDLRLTPPILSGRLTNHPEEELAPHHVARIVAAQRSCTATPGYPGVFAYDHFERADYYGCTAGYNYLFVDSRGNACPCDFTMMAFGNVREEPVAEIWRRISGRFHTPGLTCYATRIASRVVAEEGASWPLDRAASERIHDACPSWDEQLPRFFAEMGFRRR
jgi:MoaA/NifB/PqqE/SkfB family radical SAM enzyme